MFSFDDSLKYKVFVLENLLYTKHLYDRGFDVSGFRSLSGSILPQFLDILFGDGNVEWEFFEPVPPSCLEGLTEDDDEFYWITGFLQRDHAMISIKIPLLEELDGKLRPKHYRELEQIVKKLVPGELEEPWDFEEAWCYIFVRVKWLEQNGKKVGLLLHFVDIDPGWEEPYRTGWICEIFLSFWDRLQALKSEVSGNVRIHKHRNPPGRYRLGNGAEKIRGKRKAGRYRAGRKQRRIQIKFTASPLSLAGKFWPGESPYPSVKAPDFGGLLEDVAWALEDNPPVSWRDLVKEEAKRLCPDGAGGS